MSTNYLAAGRFLICNKATPVGLIGMTDEPTIKLLQVASTIASHTYGIEGVLGSYIVFGEEPMISLGEPMRANFKEAGDAVVFCFKQGGAIVYLYGITVENLIGWVPPTKATELISEDGLLQSWKATHTDIFELVPLKDTETHALRAIAEKFMSHMPTFSVHKIKDMKTARKWLASGYTSNIRAVVDKSEVEERKRAQEKSTTAKDAACVESMAGGMVAKEVWTERKRLLLTAAPYYGDTFDKRFIVVALDPATKQPTTATLEAVRLDLT